MNRVVLEYRSLPIHTPFHESNARERCVFGGYGSGKSWALCAEALAFGLEQPGSEILICRKTIPALRDTTESIFVGLIPPELWAQCETRRMGNHYESITLPNGTKYMFRGLDDWMKHKSLSVAAIFYDEVDEIDEEAYIGMMSRVRQRVPTAAAKLLGAAPINRKMICCAANPAGHNWVWKRFVSDHCAPNTAWFKSSSLDNPHLDFEYLDSLLAMPDPWVRRFVLCSFDEFGGQIYETWNHDDHLIQPFRNAGRYDYGVVDPLFLMGFDPGTSAGNAALWCYHDREKHRLVAVANYNETGLAADEHAKAWTAIEATHGMRVRARIADPKAITVRDRGSNMGLDKQYQRLGYSFQLGTNDMQTRLFSLGQLIAHKRFVCTTDCMELFEQIANYRWEDLTPAAREKGREARPIKKDVDLVDAAQYLAARHINPPKLEAPRTDVETHAQEIRDAIRNQLRQKTATAPHDLGTLIV